MDISTDIWGQLAVEASQVYLSDGTMRSPFADTVDIADRKSQSKRVYRSD